MAGRTPVPEAESLSSLAAHRAAMAIYLSMGQVTRVAEISREMAERLGARLTLLHVLPPPHYEFSSMEVGGTVLNELFEARNPDLGFLDPLRQKLHLPPIVEDVGHRLV